MFEHVCTYACTFVHTCVIVIRVVSMTRARPYTCFAHSHVRMHACVWLRCSYTLSCPRVSVLMQHVDVLLLPLETLCAPEEAMVRDKAGE